MKAATRPAGQGPRDPRLSAREEQQIAVLGGVSFRAVRAYLLGRARISNVERIERALSVAGRSDLLLGGRS
jgi:hypothetical protein